MSNLPEMIQALIKPEAYPEPTEGIELEQTQMSFVFLTDNYAYKVKKPVNLGYLDYTTLEKRRHFCYREVELNKRLCSNAYLGVVTINRQRDNYSICGAGEVMEYAVKMRRLPHQLMMDWLLKSGSVSIKMISRLADKIVTFHRQAETSGEINAFGSIDTIIQNTEENYSQTENYIGKTISSFQYQQIKEYSHSFIADNTALFNKRVKGNHIRDCHGDLHTAHVCFKNGICIYDCIEFNDRFRYGDVAAEVAFLAMDLDHHERADLSRIFVKEYMSKSHDAELEKLLNFYKCYRAYVRGKVASFKLDDAYITDDERVRTIQTAGSYFDLAYSYIKSIPSLFITTGLVGSGKTALSQILAGRMGLVVLSSDVIRKRLAHIPQIERRFEEYDNGIYSPEFSRKTYDTMLDEAKNILAEGGSVIMDASFIKAGERQRAKALAEEMGAGFYILECRSDEETIRRRLSQRLEKGSVSDGRWEIYLVQKERFEPVLEVSPQKRVIIDTAKPIDNIMRYVIGEIARDE
ncbi:MAG: AAA family ATPase [Dehalococcoidia bacterium]|nr:MAG: AAA family ATPase [Dehalococcoidia bacterium]